MEGHNASRSDGGYNSAEQANPDANGTRGDVRSGPGQSSRSRESPSTHGLAASRNAVLLTIGLALVVWWYLRSRRPVVAEAATDGKQIVLVGASDVGKTTLFLRMAKALGGAVPGDFEPRTVPTLEVGTMSCAVSAAELGNPADVFSIPRGGTRVTLVDTPGHATLRHVARARAARADALVLVLDGSPRDAEVFLAVLGAVGAGAALICAWNKNDRAGLSNPHMLKRALATRVLQALDADAALREKHQRAYETLSETKNISSLHPLTCVLTSAKNGQGMADLWKAISGVL